MPIKVVIHYRRSGGLDSPRNWVLTPGTGEKGFTGPVKVMGDIDNLGFYRYEVKVEDTATSISFFLKRQDLDERDPWGSGDQSLKFTTHGTEVWYDSGDWQDIGGHATINLRKANEVTPRYGDDVIANTLLQLQGATASLAASAEAGQVVQAFVNDLALRPLGESLDDQAKFSAAADAVHQRLETISQLLQDAIKTFLEGVAKEPGRPGDSVARAALRASAPLQQFLGWIQKSKAGPSTPPFTAWCSEALGQLKSTVGAINTIPVEAARVYPTPPEYLSALLMQLEGKVADELLAIFETLENTPVTAVAVCLASEDEEYDDITLDAKGKALKAKIDARPPHDRSAQGVRWMIHVDAPSSQLTLTLHQGSDKWSTTVTPTAHPTVIVSKQAGKDPTFIKLSPRLIGGAW
jgi:hypothetical protein